MMADGRILSKRISRSSKIASLSSDTSRMFYSWLIPYLDVEGRLEADPKLLKADITPLLDHITPKVIQNILTELHDIGLIKLYIIEERQYLQLIKFNENQKNLRKDREAPSIIPEVPANIPLNSGDAPAKCGHKIKIKRSLSLREVKINTCANGNEFARLWKLYPKKKSIGQAEKAFSKINPDEQLLDLMLSKIEQAKKSEEWIKEKGRYIPYLATWLNAKGWEDEETQTHPLSGIVSDKTIGTVTMLDEWRPPT
jgi:hypothetical protein